MSRGSMSTNARRILIGASVAVILTACGGDDGIADRPSGFAPGVGEQTGAEPSASQVQILADDVVTAAEYEQAVFSEARCLNEAGLEVLGPEWNRSANEIEFTIRASLPAGATAEDQAALDARIDRAADGCWIEFSAFVEEKWFSQLVPDGDERQALVESLVACIRATGTEIADDPSYEDLTSIVPSLEEDEARALALAQCAESHARLFIVPPAE